MKHSCFEPHSSDGIIASLLVKNGREIVDEWGRQPRITTVCEKFGFDSTFFLETIAQPVLNYFIALFRHKEQPDDDCPVMRSLIDTFFMHGLAVEHIFTFCTTFKNRVISHAIANRLPDDAREHLFDVFDCNLTHMLEIYTHRLFENEKLLNIHAKIIEEHVVLSTTDLEGRVTYASDAFCNLTGYSREEWIGKTHAIIRHPDMPNSMFAKMWNNITQGKEYKAIMKNLKRNGQTFIAKTRIVPIFNDNAEIIEYIAIREDITDKELINYDPLTKIYNRRMFDTLFAKAIENAQVNETPLCLMIVDIDHFKKINDRFGHKEGDRVLVEMARILLKNLRHIDSCSRWGGEEFAILLPNARLEEAINVAERIRYSVEKELKAKSEVQTCSIGLSMLQADDSETILFERADRAMYEAKRNGRNRTIHL